MMSMAYCFSMNHIKTPKPPDESTKNIMSAGQQVITEIKVPFNEY